MVCIASIFTLIFDDSVDQKRHNYNSKFDWKKNCYANLIKIRNECAFKEEHNRNSNGNNRKNAETQFPFMCWNFQETSIALFNASPGRNAATNCVHQSVAYAYASWYGTVQRTAEHTTCHISWDRSYIDGVRGLPAAVDLM